MAPVVRKTAEDLLESGSLVVVPTEGAAHRLRRQHDQRQHELARTTWTPSSVLSWDQWLRSLWSQSITYGLEFRLLLNTTQEHRLWREIVQSQSAGSIAALTSADSLANLAAAAWRLSESFDATRRLRQFSTTHDARLFADWANSFARICQTRGYLSRASLEAALQIQVAARELSLTEPITFAGFASWTPAQRSFLQTLKDLGIKFTETEMIASGPANNFILEVDSLDGELESIALWIRASLQSRAANASSARIAVLVPGLEAERASIESVFRRVLAPELQSVHADDSESPFTFARSRPLRDEPMIAVALDLARWATGPLGRESTSALLLSPYLSSEPALAEAGTFDACHLRVATLLRPEIELSWLVKQIARTASAKNLTWPQSLSRFIENAEGLDALRSFAQWTEFIRQLLRASGWPGSHEPNANELAVARALEHALDSVATLDFNGDRATFSEALHALEQELARSSASHALHAPVHILEPTEAEGMTFDAMVFARATDTNWPSLPQTNPLISWQLQLTLGMPGADRIADMARARKATGSLLHSAESVVFTYSSASAEGPQRLTTLINELNLPIRTPSDLALASASPFHIEPELSDDTIALPPLPSAHVHGGATILQHQAACGFRAFAEVRLRSLALESRGLGYDARERGNLLHSVMQSFWERVKSQRALRAMPTEQRRAVLTECIDASIDLHAQHNHWDSAYVHLQKQRLTRLLTHWLSSELDRSDFEVRSTEEKKTLAVGPLEFSLRVDRIDLTEDGEFLVDYKTGSSASSADWEGERPEEPQLPLYTMLAREHDLAGLAFAKIRPGKTMGWQGYAAQDGVLPGRNTTRELPILQERWAATLTALAHNFADGEISVDPKSYPTTCTYCAQRLLCRLDAATLLDTEDPTEPTEEEAIA